MTLSDLHVNVHESFTNKLIVNGIESISSVVNDTVAITVLNDTVPITCK